MNLNFAVMSFFPVMWKSKKKDLIFNIKWCIYHVAISSDIERASYQKKKTSDREYMRLSSSMYSIFYAVSIKNKKFQLVNAKFNLFSNFTRLDDGGIYHVFHIIQTLESLNLCLA